MTTILHIDSSGRYENSITRSLSNEALASFKKQHPDAKIISRDLTKTQPPHTNPEFVTEIFGGPKSPNNAASKLSNEFLEELFAADILVIGAPMYNFSIPSQLKAWIDLIIRAGKTFNFEKDGPKGLITGKRAIVLTASGGAYSGGEYDHVGPYMKQILGFIGITDVTIIRAEKQAYGPDVATAEVTHAKQEIETNTKRAA